MSSRLAQNSGSMSDSYPPQADFERSRFEIGGRLRVELNERLWR
jgi:hypothetical protein